MTTRLPLYALPGLLNDGRVWQHQADALSAERAVATADTAGSDSIAALASAALARAPAARFALAGFSLGGYVALEMMRQAPGRVAALALIDTSARPDSPQASEMRRRMIEGVRRGGFGAVAAGFLPLIVHPSRAGDAALVALLADMARAVGADGFARQQQAAMGRIDSRPFLKDIACPTLVLCGREDRVTPPEASEELAGGIAGARLVVVEQCGHMAPLERPEAVTRALIEWLGGVAEE